MRSFTFALKPVIVMLLIGLAATSYAREVNVQEEISKLFESGCHRDIDNRREWIYNWVTRQASNSLLDSIPTTDPTVQKKRLDFLKAHWGHKNFLPFEGHEVRAFFDDPNTTFLIRLSTTMPGAITVTCKKPNGVILNTRMYDLEKSIDEMIDSLTKGNSNTDFAANYIALE